MAIQNIQHFALTVPDLLVAQAFYRDFGLDAVERDGRLVCRCFGRDQDQVVLVEGPRKRLNYVSFGTDEEGLGEAMRRLESASVKIIDPPRDVRGEGLWFRDFDGMLTNLRVAAEAPWDTNSRVTFNTLQARRARAGRTELIEERPVKPRRLGHIVTFSSDPFRKVDFYNRMFDMKLSDRVADFLSFLHAANGSDHHVIAFGKSTTYGLHHAGFDVGSSDEVAAGGQILMDKGYVPSWGPGRHFVGSNAFMYVRDPWNSLHEYFADIDYIGRGHPWEPSDWKEVGTRSIWGAPEPRDFATNFEAIHLR